MRLNDKVKDMDTKESRMSEIESCSIGGLMDKKTVLAFPLDQVSDLHRFAQVLVRCGGGRFICSAQDAKHFMSIITNEDSDYVRDVSIIPQGSGSSPAADL